jgi:hypothetical protein
MQAATKMQEVGKIEAKQQSPRLAQHGAISQEKVQERA